MAKLADEVRAAYERHQAGFGDVGDARHRLIRNALTAPARESHRLQWAAALAAVLIAAVVITTFALVRGNIRPGPVPGATPRPSASPTALRNPINVPDSTPLVLYQDPVKADQLDGVTWDGKSSGTVVISDPAAVGNPQNNLFAGTAAITDRSGNTVMTGTFGLKFFGGTWADDGRHLCQLVPFDNPGAGIPTTLQLVTAGEGIRNVAQVGTLYSQTFVRVAACSVLADRAVVVQSGGQGVGTADVWAVELSTGRIVWTHRYEDTTTPVYVVASRDGMYVAENISKPGSTIYGPDGKVVTVLNAQVEAFSWDGNLAVVDAGYGSTPVDVISWRIGTVFWSCPPGTALLRALPQPDGTELAVSVAPISEFQQQTQFPDLYVLGADGSVIFRAVHPSQP